MSQYQNTAGATDGSTNAMPSGDPLMNSGYNVMGQQVMGQQMMNPMQYNMGMQPDQTQNNLNNGNQK